MKRVFRIAAVLLGLMLPVAGQAVAAQKSTFVVLPFSIQGPQGYAYLERSIPQMLNSRLYWKDHVEPVRREVAANVQPPASENAAEQLRKQYKADYVVWGSVTVVGDDCSLDVRVRDKSGKVWPQVREAKAPQLLNAVTGVSDSINREVFGRTSPAVGAAPAGGGRVNQMNSGIMINETSDREVYLNPQFRYSGDRGNDDSRLRSPAMAYSSVGMEVVDADGNGKNEVLILGDRALRVYSFNGGQMQELGAYEFPITSQTLSIRSLPHPSGRPWIIVNTLDSKGVPCAYVLTYAGGSFTEEVKGAKFYLNVAKLPPTYAPVLIGQKPAPPRLFRGGVFEVSKQGNTLIEGRQLALPADANVFNFSYVPGDHGDVGAEKLIVLTSRERLAVYSNKGNRLSQSDETYSGAAVGIEVDPSIPGMGKEKVTIGTMFYIPMRMLAIDLERNGTWELLVNRPISTASQIFDRYRFFPQSEIHSLFWDGIGLNLQWKTRRIKGSMVDYTIADADNNGVLDLVVCLNTHPGALGVKARKTVVMLYPLDVTKVDPSTAPYQGDYYD